MDAAVGARLLTSNPCGRHHRLRRLRGTGPTILAVTDVEGWSLTRVTELSRRGRGRSGAQPIAPDPSLALLVELLAYGGLRIGELALGPTTSHQVRDVPLPLRPLPELTLGVRAAPTPDALMFTGGVLHDTSVRRSFDAACRRGASGTAGRASPLGTTLVR